MKPFITILFLCLLSSVALADNEYKCIWVKHADNTSTCIMLDSDPQISFDGETVTIGMKSFQLNDIVSYRFGKDPDASLENLPVGENSIVFDGDLIIIKNISTKSGARIFDTRGILMKEVRPALDIISLKVDISDLGTGVYFLTIDGQSLKFVKR